MECTFQSRLLTLREPLRAAWGELSEREIVEVTLRAHDGAVGRGEAAPLEPYDGVPAAAVTAALDVYATILEDADMNADRQELLALCAAERPLPQALAAIDLALWDMDGQRADRSVAELILHALHGDGHDHQPLPSIPVNAVVSATDRATAAKQAAEYTKLGYETIKVKVGIGDDAGRLAAIRAAIGPATNVRVDANGAWSTPAEALANLRALEPMALELCEEPVHGETALREVKDASPVPIAMDETDAPGSGAAHIVCLKISRGGISQVLADTLAARGAGSEVLLASTFDGPTGIAAAVHVAAALAPRHACGLATLSAFADLQDARLRVTAGRLAVPRGPGLLG